MAFAFAFAAGTLPFGCQWVVPTFSFIPLFFSAAPTCFSRMPLAALSPAALPCKVERRKEGLVNFVARAESPREVRHADWNKWITVGLSEEEVMLVLPMKINCREFWFPLG
jgi:hypothetical protein